MPLPDLAPEQLHVLVFGPGKGELILVRAPPDAWMVVDGCGAGGRGYAAAVLDHYDARPRLLVLTHPHDDHSHGMGDLVRRTTAGIPSADWPRIGMVLPPGGDVAADSGGFIAAITLDAIAAVEDRWSAEPACRWDMDAGSQEALGEAEVRAVSPAAGTRTAQLQRWRNRRRFDRNVISSALLVTWRGRRILLGSDLVERPGGGWSASLVLDPDLGDHDVLKVPHHGSDHALHDDILRPAARVPAPLRVIAPFNTHDLPSFEPGAGVPYIYQRAGTAFLTGLPRPHDEQSGRLETRPLADLCNHGSLVFNPTTAGFPDCFVVVSFPPDGSLATVHRGPGSVHVER